jgi:thymidylate synthase
MGGVLLLNDVTAPTVSMRKHTPTHYNNNCHIYLDKADVVFQAECLDQGVVYVQ